MSFISNNNFDFGVAVKRGSVPNFSGIQKFGRNPAVSSTEETIANQGGNYSYISTARTATVTSSNTGADNGGTVKIDGLDTNYNEVSETATIGGSATTQTFIRVNRATLITANTGTANVGNVSITIDSTTAGYIPATYSQTLQAVYTVPAKHQAYLIQLDGGTDEKEKPIHMVLKTRDTQTANASFQTKTYLVFENTRTEHKFLMPEVIPEKHDIELRAVSPEGELEVSGGFELVIEKVDQS